MRGYYPYRWFQDGGGVGWPAGVPTPQEMAMRVALQRAFAPQPAQVVVPSGSQKKEGKKRRVMLPPPEPRVRGDIGVGLPTRVQVEGLIQQGRAERQKLVSDLVRLGYPQRHAEAMISQGRSKLPENVKEKLENQAASDYRVQHHPDYDPSRPVEDQQYLNYDNSFRTRVLRGANMFVDSGDPVVDFIAGALTTPGRSFANITMDAEKRYVQPIVNEGWRGVPGAVGNLGLDVMGVVPADAAAGYVTQRVIPAARNMAAQAYKINPWAKGNVFNRWDADNFYRIVDEAAYKDALQSGVIRSNPSGDAKGVVEGLSIQLGRPTAFPSFAKSAPDVTYLPKDGNGYIIESAIPMFKRGEVNPVTGNVIKGRHWAYRPIDMTTGEAMSSIPLSEVNIYRPHWLKGYKLADYEDAGNGVMNRLVSRGLPEESAAMERALLRSWRPPNVIRDNGIPGDRGEDDFLNKYLGSRGELVSKVEEGLPHGLDEATLKEVKDAFLKRMPGMKDYVDDIFNDPAKLKAFISQLPPEVDKALLRDKLQRLSLDELKNNLKGRPLGIEPPGVGGAPWNFGRITQQMRGPYVSKEMEERQRAMLRNLFENNMEQADTRQLLLDVLSNPVTHQRMGGVVPAMPMIGIRRGDDMGWYYPYRWFQDGGSTDWPAGVPTPQEMAMRVALQRAFAPQPAQVVVPSGSQKKDVPKRKVMLPPPEPRVRGDIGVGLPTRAQVEGLIQQGRAEQQRLQGQLERVGYKGAYAAAMARQGRSKLPENVKEKLENQAASDYRVQHHPDYDPSRPVEDQQYLNYDNSFRTRVLRGANMFVDSGDPVVDFIAGTMTAPGRSFANITMDAEKRYVQPIVNEGWRGVPGAVGNFGLDVMGLATTNAVGNRIVNRLVSRGLPEGSAAMERALLQSWRPPMGGVQHRSRVLGNAMEGEGDQFLFGKEGLPTNVEVSAAFKDEVRKAADDYFKLTKDPRYQQRIRDLDKELKLDGELERRWKLFAQQAEETAGDDLPFNMRIAPLKKNVWGESKVHSDILDPLLERKDKGEISDAFLEWYFGSNYMSPQQREILISPLAGKEGLSLADVVKHELKHHWLNGVMDRDIKKYGKWLSSPKMGELESLLSGVDNNFYLYHTNPTEIDAYLMTNLRDDLLKKGYLKDHFDVLTKEQLDDYLTKYRVGDEAGWPILIQKYFNKGKELVGDKDKFIDVFNKALPVATGVGVGMGVMGAGQEEKRWGGEKVRAARGGLRERGRGVPGMPLIGVRGLI